MIALLSAATTDPGKLIVPKLSPTDFFWMPPQASTVAGDIDATWNFLVWMSVICAVAIFAVMFHFVSRYRAKSREANERADTQNDHDTTLEVTWSILPLFVVIGIFVWGFKGFLDLRTPPKDAYEIHVTGQKWKWLFQYPNGHIDDRLYTPANRPVRLIMESVDVIHSLWVPAYRVKQDVVPGRYTELWFEATKPGTYALMCTEYCGTAHSDMLSETIALPQAEFDAWLAEAERKFYEETPERPLAKIGEEVYGKMGCAVCHSTDGSVLTGPSFKGLFGKSEALVDGSSVTVDENYIRESVLQPNAKVVRGFAPSMPTFQGKIPDKGIKALVEFIKAQK